MRLHILGICGTFMAGIALLAKQAGHTVSGSDQAVYPPMSDQLRAQGITLHEGYSADALMPEPDLVIVGNAIKRGNPAMEWLLNYQESWKKIPYMSGPEWLYREVLSKQKTVLAVAGTHGKTTTSSLLAWILEVAGQQPGFLIGGVPQNFGVSARLGQGECFVVEADEYDTAFFDKRSKLVHYHPDIAIINNLEYDHADIFPDLAAIQKQMHHMVRTIPGKGTIIRPSVSTIIDEVMEMGCWSHVQTFFVGEMNDNSRSDWQAKCLQKDGSEFKVTYRDEQATAHWPLIGTHNVSNALAAIAAAHVVHVPIQTACDALSHFNNVKRRLELRGKVREVTVYDDFAHHPTAIEATLQALRAHVGDERIVAILHLASNSMKMGIYDETLGPALKKADLIFVLKPQNLEALAWTKQGNVDTLIHKADTVDELVQLLIPCLRPHDHVLVMSNGDFGGIHDKILNQLALEQ